MHRLIRYAFVFVLISIIDIGLCSDASAAISNTHEDDAPESLSSETTTIDFISEKVVLNSNDESSFELNTTTNSIINDIVNDALETTTINLSTTTEKRQRIKQFLSKYSLNLNVSSSSLSDIILPSCRNDLIILASQQHEILLINKTDETLYNEFNNAHLIPVYQQTAQANFLVIYNENAQELWLIDSTDQQTVHISFKPKRIFILPSASHSWIAETSDEVELYISFNSGKEWTKIDQTSSSTVLGWSSEANAVLIVQHAHYLKWLDVKTFQLTSIFTDVAATKSFSKYLLTKQSNTDNSITISHINGLADRNFRPLSKHFQNQGNFYCAIEDVNSQDLLLLFITDNKLEESNETSTTTCNLLGHSKRNLFNISNINCATLSNQSSVDAIECSTKQIPFYQVRGLSKSVFLVNVGVELTTMISLDGGLTWNRTNFECDRKLKCPNSISLIMSSLTSSNEAPGIILGTASDGVNEYIAISADGGRSWRLSSKSKGYLTAVSKPNALIVALSNYSQQTLGHTLQYSTDYGRNWRQEILLNDTTFQIVSLIADNNNTFHMLILDNENQFHLIELDFNLLIKERCARHQLKEWSSTNVCVNGSKTYYKRRIYGSYCVDEVAQARIEPCICSLSDFTCLPGYKQLKGGLCLPRPRHVLSYECTDNNNSSLVTKLRGYAKLENSQCTNGIENYLKDINVKPRDPTHPNVFVYGTNSRTNQTKIEIHTDDFDQNDDNSDDDDESATTQNASTSWLIDPSYEIAALIFDEINKQVYIAVQYEQTSIIYRIRKNLRQPIRDSQRLTFDANNELYRSTDDHVEHLSIDIAAQNLYVLIRNKNTLEQAIFILDIRTHKRRTIVKNQRIHPSTVIVDSIKNNLYWISRASPSTINIGNLQGEIKRRTQLVSAEFNVEYIAYDPLTHELIYIVNSKIYGFNTLLQQNQHESSSRVIYEHSSNIQNPLFINPILYFTQENNEIDSKEVRLNSIDILAKSFAQNITKFKNLNSLKLFIDMAPNSAIGSKTTANPCANNPCSDLCIPLENGRFRCICSDDTRQSSCLCPSDERYVSGSCQAKNGQCASGRVLCQNQLNCAESARICEEYHTQYNESFKSTARCTIDKPNDGFDCYYTDVELNGAKDRCIPFEWFCDGTYDCPLGNDEEHCHKITTTTAKVPNRCLTEKKFTHVLCKNKCMQVNDVCRSSSNMLLCPDEFSVNCKPATGKNEYTCKCRDDENRCFVMIEHCDSHEHCEQVCNDSIHYATSKLSQPAAPSIIALRGFVIVVLVVIVIGIFLLIVRCIRRRKQTKKTPVASRTPAESAAKTTSDAHEQLLNKAPLAAAETS